MRLLSLLFILVYSVSTVNAEERSWTGNLNVLLGGKAVEEDDWEPVDEHGAFGMLLDFRKKTWPVSIVLDSIHSGSEEDEGSLEIEGTTSEFNIGVRKIWEFEDKAIRPFIGGGLALIQAEQISRNRFNATLDDDSGVGVWMQAGIYWTVTNHFNIGFDLRHSIAEAELFNEDIDVGGTTFGMLLGYHF